MYIDKIYTKLYSNKDWNGLEQLISEIRQFANSDYEGLSFMDRVNQRALRNYLADYVKSSKDSLDERGKKSVIELADNVSRLNQNRVNNNALGMAWNRMNIDGLKDDVPGTEGYAKEAAERSKSLKNKTKAIAQEVGSTIRNAFKR